MKKMAPLLLFIIRPICKKN